MGGRGAFAGGGGGGGGNELPRGVQSTTSLISMREGKESEVDDTLKVLRDIQNEYGVDVMDAEIAIYKKPSSTMAYYDAKGNVAVNNALFDNKIMNETYDRCIAQGFHPQRGNKTGLEATVAHEMGHRLTDVAAQKAGYAPWAGLDIVAGRIVDTAKKSLGYSNRNQLMSKISGYAQKNAAETIAEAFSDVYCNGNKAARESRAVVNALNSYYGK